MMNKEDKFLRTLMQELPKEKASEGITQLIMQKITVQSKVFVPIRTTKVWQTQAFYIMIAIVAVEAWLLWSVRKWFTLANFEAVAKKAYIEIYQYFALNNFSTPLLILVLIGVCLYLFVKNQIEAKRCCIGMV